MKEKCKRPMKRFLSLLLTAAMLVAMPESFVRAETAKQQTTEREMPKNPVHHCAKEYVDWSYVYFGSYPQTEVTGSELTEEITGASYDTNGDALVDGVKYRRISESDTNNSDYFGDSEYRYFKWERIKWKVLQNDGSTLFVVADKGLDCKDYNEKDESVTWETCTLRNWLNNDFYNTAFSSSEQGAIVEQTVVNEDNPEYGTEGGNDTLDNVYLLSIGEVANQTYGFCEKYDKISVSRRFKASDYAYVMGASYINGIGRKYGSNCYWWLRSPANITRTAVTIDEDGRYYSHIVDFDEYAVVPALHINLASGLWSVAEYDTVSELPKNPVNHSEDGENDYADCSYVYFGSYPQTEVTGSALTEEITGASYDSNGDAWVNGVKYRRRISDYRYFKWERIKWRVLKNNGSTLFVVANKGLDYKDYNEENTAITWENCTIRSWLNHDFYGTAFSSAEQGAIAEQTVVNEDNPQYGTEGGNDTLDKVFLLSIGEVENSEYGFCEEYGTYSVSRRIKASDYARAKVTLVNNSKNYEENCYWWLRSPGNGTHIAAGVRDDGSVPHHGYGFLNNNHTVVPALHINLSSDLWSLAEDENAEDIIGAFQIENTAEAVSGSEATISGTLTLSDEAEASADLLQSEVSKITWNSSDSGVAEVKGCTGQNASDNRSSSLTVTIAAKKAGTAVIIGTTSNGKKASCTVTVKGTTVSETPKNPVHHCTKENDGTDTTDWNYVYFGSYPQTEVTGAALTPAITGASYDENKDAWVNGVKYRRISKDDTNGSLFFGDSEYRYFKWERMKWRVLQNNGSTMFVVADKGLDCKDYNDTYEPVTWEDCTLRNWLNNDFYNTAFSDSEQGAVIGQTVANEDNLEYGTAGGNNTADKVYLLSDREITDKNYGFCEDYNVWSASRRFETSDYSCARGVSRDCDDEGNQYCWWWLRSPGGSTYDAMDVNTDGKVNQDGREVLISCDVSPAVIPALYIDLSSNLWSLAEADKPNIPNTPDCTHTHTELRNQKNPTCQAAGYSGDKWCKDCQKQIETGKTLPKTAHNYTTSVIKATDSKNGSIQKKCKLCGFVQSNTAISRISSASISQTKYTYDGTKKQPAVSVLDSAGKTIDAQYYTVSYQNNESVGTASAVITFKGNYSGTLVKNFDINPQTTRITKVKARNKGFEAKWKKQASQTTGYQLQYSTSKKFTKKTTKTKTVKKSSKTNLTIGKLKSGKKYYVRIRTYQTVNGTKYYSEWSKSKKITTKRS